MGHAGRGAGGECGTLSSKHHEEFVARQENFKLPDHVDGPLFRTVHCPLVGVGWDRFIHASAPVTLCATAQPVELCRLIQDEIPADHKGPELLTQWGLGGRPAPLASLFHRIPTRFPLNLRAF